MDTNVDPSSTLAGGERADQGEQDVRPAVIPGGRHGPGGPYGERKRYDFFVQHLLGAAPPAWNEIKAKTETPATR